MDRSYATEAAPATLQAAVIPGWVRAIHAFWGRYIVGWAKRSVPTAFLVGTAQKRLCPPYRLLKTATKNPSVPVRRGVISQPSGEASAAAAKASALSHSTEAVSSGGTTANSA